MRLDVYLAENRFAKSRTEAKEIIIAGDVSVNGKPATKPALDVCDGDEIRVEAQKKKYVSRGGYKLEAALDDFKIDPSDKKAIDVGASSGGFTDCLLQRGADHVIAVDSGYGQMSASLIGDERITLVENYNARNMDPQDLEYLPELAVMDVSFISATLIIPALSTCLVDGADFVCLIKPQFEVGRSGLGKGGIVKSEKLRQQAVERVIDSAQATGFTCLGVIKSPITGGDGNVEYLAHFRKVK
jgi:23S rRNA (cytidine1920-2'-O)/16S rRNA (cytidine1409-2'-O)-methyltransferase